MDAVIGMEAPSFSASSLREPARSPRLRETTHGEGAAEAETDSVAREGALICAYMCDTAETAENEDVFLQICLITFYCCSLHLISFMCFSELI